jgi:hypothetical protein
MMTAPPTRSAPNGRQKEQKDKDIVWKREVAAAIGGPPSKAPAKRSLLHATHQDLAAEIWMIPVLDFRLLPDMGRMNGQ